jgi:hypothetical protein
VRKEALAKLPGEAILAQLHLGFMTMVATLTDEEKRAVASYIAGKPVARPSNAGRAAPAGTMRANRRRRAAGPVDGTPLE